MNKLFNMINENPHLLNIKKDGDTLLLYYIKNNFKHNIEYIKMFINNESLLIVDKFLNSPLYNYILYCDVIDENIIKLLSNKEVNNLENYSKKTPLHYYLIRGEVKKNIVNLLITKENTNIKDISSNIPAIYYTRYNVIDDEILKILVKDII